MLAELLATRQPPAVQTAAVETLARFDDNGAASILLERMAGNEPQAARDGGRSSLCQTRLGASVLGCGRERNSRSCRCRPRPARAAQEIPCRRGASAGRRIFAAATARRQDVVAAYQQSLQLKGDRERGKAVFKEHCSSCHRLEGVGRQIGSDLAAIRDRGLDSVLLNILDPNREVMPQFQSYVLVTTAGRVLTGMIAEETANSLTIRKPDGSDEIVPRLQIDELRGTGLSFMPEAWRSRSTSRRWPTCSRTSAR